MQEYWQLYTSQSCCCSFTTRSKQIDRHPPSRAQTAMISSPVFTTRTALDKFLCWCSTANLYGSYNVFFFSSSCTTVFCKLFFWPHECEAAQQNTAAFCLQKIYMHHSPEIIGFMSHSSHSASHPVCRNPLVHAGSAHSQFPLIQSAMTTDLKEGNFHFIVRKKHDALPFAKGGNIHENVNFLPFLSELESVYCDWFSKCSAS